MSGDNAIVYKFYTHLHKRGHTLPILTVIFIVFIKVDSNSLFSVFWTKIKQIRCEYFLTEKHLMSPCKCCIRSMSMYN